MCIEVLLFADDATLLLSVHLQVVHADVLCESSHLGSLLCSSHFFFNLDLSGEFSLHFFSLLNDHVLLTLVIFFLSLYVFHNNLIPFTFSHACALTLSHSIESAGHSVFGPDGLVAGRSSLGGSAAHFRLLAQSVNVFSGRLEVCFGSTSVRSSTEVVNNLC